MRSGNQTVCLVAGLFKNRDHGSGQCLNGQHREHIARVHYNEIPFVRAALVSGIGMSQFLVYVMKSGFNGLWRVRHG